MPINVDFAASFALHPLIAEHPHYKSILSDTYGKYEFNINDSTSNLHIVPTFPKMLGAPHGVIIEDLITLLYPYVHNGSNENWDYRNSPWLNLFRNWFESPDFRGIITHMGGTVCGLVNLFNSKIINEKIYYIPLGGDIAKNIKPTNYNKIVLTFTNSFGGNETNFKLRGGVEVVLAYKELYELGITNLWLNLVGYIGVNKELKEWLEKCPNVSFAYPSVETYDRLMVAQTAVDVLLKETDIFLIPSCRIHTISMMKAMCQGCVVLGSDGWGFNEFLHPENMCKGQKKTAYEDENGILRENYSFLGEDHNQVLVESLKNKIFNLINIPRLDFIKEDMLRLSEKLFSKDIRREKMTKALDKMYEKN